MISNRKEDKMNETNDTVLYTMNGCPRCAVLKKKLAEAGIAFCENNSEADMKALGIDELPVLCHDGKLMTFMEAVEMINSKER